MIRDRAAAPGLLTIRSERDDARTPTRPRPILDGALQAARRGGPPIRRSPNAVRPRGRRELGEPGKLYEGSSDNARRQLLEAFYSRLLGNEEIDSIEVDGIERALVADLRIAAQISHETSARKHRSPRLSTRATAVSTSVGSFDGHFHDLGLNKTTLVGLTGFEPATP